jgi:single-strand DNA-binding protein
MIKLQLIGRLGRDATAKEFNEKFVIDLNVAVSERYKEEEKTTWVKASYWVKSDKLVQYLTKGSIVYLEGRPSVEVFVNKDGESKASLVLTVNTLELISGAKQQEETQVSTATADDLPF